MLILSRRVGETFMIGDEITITILGVRANQVKIGIDAPKTVPIYREELLHQIRQTKSGKQTKK